MKTLSWLVPASFLLLGVGANITLMGFAISDPGFALEENYYERAVRFDESAARQARQRALGWEAAAAVGHKGGGTPRVVVTLRDGQGGSLAAARVELAAFAIARASDVRRIALVEDRPGVYAAPWPGARSGLWQLDIKAQRDDTQTAEWSLRLDVDAAP